MPIFVRETQKLVPVMSLYIDIASPSRDFQLILAIGGLYSNEDGGYFPYYALSERDSC